MDAETIDYLKAERKPGPYPYYHGGYGGAYLTERAHEAIERWVMQGIPPGDFLTAVICNDLKEAVGRADDEHLRNIAAVVAYLYNHCPRGCWGSPERYREWAEAHAEWRRRENG